MKAISKSVGYLDGKKITDKNVKWNNNELLQELEELEYNVAGSLAWSEKHSKEEMLSAILNNLSEIIDKYFNRKSIGIKL